MGGLHFTRSCTEISPSHISRLIIGLMELDARNSTRFIRAGRDSIQEKRGQQYRRTKGKSDTTGRGEG